MWSYIVNGQQTDKQTAAAVLDLLKTGALPETALVFGPGMKAWKPAIEVHDFLKQVADMPRYAASSVSKPGVSKPGETIVLFVQLAGFCCLIAAVLVLFQLGDRAISPVFVLLASVSAVWAGIVCFWMATMASLLAELVVQGRKS